MSIYSLLWGALSLGPATVWRNWSLNAYINLEKDLNIYNWKDLLKLMTKYLNWCQKSKTINPETIFKEIDNKETCRT